MTAVEVNIPLLRKAVEWAEAEAAKPVKQSSWNQEAWVSQPQHAGRDQSCGTCYCIAGFAVSQTAHVEAGEVVWQIIVDGAAVEEDDFQRQAAESLGISSDDQASRLFDSKNSIDDIRRIAEDIAGERL